MLLAGFMVLSLCACGSSAPQEVEPSFGDQMYEKYADIIGALEEERYDDAIDAISAMKPEPEEIVVEITPENFWDYYEVVYSDSILNKDAAGNILSIWGSQDFYLALKEEYASVLVPDNPNIEVGVTADVVMKRLESVDWNSGEYQISNENYDDMEAAYVSSWSMNKRTAFDDISTVFSGSKRLSAMIYNTDFAGGFLYQYTDNWGTYWRNGDIKPDDSYDEVYIVAPENIEIVRAEGTLVLSGK